MGPSQVSYQVESSRRIGWRSALTLAVSSLLVGLSASDRPARAADPRPVAVEDVRVGFDGRYKVGTWTPVWVLLRGGPDGFSGEMDAVVEDENGTPTTVRQAIQVGPGGTQRVTVYVRPGSLDPDFAVLRFFNGKTGRLAVPEFVVGSISASANTPNKLESIGQGDYQLVTLGHPYGVEGIPKIPGFNASPSNPANNGRAREVAVTQISSLGAADQLPGRWYGYDSADAVVIDTNDAETLSALNGGRIEAIRQWVERGGHLIVAVSSRWQAVNDGPLASLLPAKVVGQTQVSPFDSLESFTGGSQHLDFENAPVQAAKFADVEARGGRVVASTLSTPLVVRGPYGFGRVTLVGLDVDAKPFSAWPDRTLFWVKVIDLKAPAGAADSTSAASQRIMNRSVSDFATMIRLALDQFQGMTVIPFGWVAGFIAIYILLIGPGDYFFLKKVLKRMELTWITFPTIVVTVSLLAYFAAYKIKGTDLRVNQIDVVDIDMPQKITRGTSWINLFSPQNRDYSIEVQPQGVAPNPKTPAAPGTEAVVSWFAAPESGLRGMNSRGQGIGFSGSGYTYAPPGRLERLEDVRVGIWSTKGVLARWFGPAPQADSILDVDLQPVGTDRLAGTVTNRMTFPLHDTIIVFGKHVYYDLKTIEPGATVQVDATLDRGLASYLKEAREQLVPKLNVGGVTNKAINRASLAREIMFHDSDASGEENIPSRTHRELDLTGQLALDRPMLVARVDHPGAVLKLGNAPGAIKTDQTTLLRIILPLKPEAASSSTTPSPSTPKGPRS